MKAAFKWSKNNAVAVFLSFVFVIIYIIKEFKPEINDILGSCSLRACSVSFSARLFGRLCR